MTTHSVAASSAFCQLTLRGISSSPPTPIRGTWVAWTPLLVLRLPLHRIKRADRRWKNKTVLQHLCYAAYPATGGGRHTLPARQDVFLFTHTRNIPPLSHTLPPSTLRCTCLRHFGRLYRHYLMVHCWRARATPLPENFLLYRHPAAQRTAARAAPELPGTRKSRGRCRRGTARLSALQQRPISQTFTPHHVWVPNTYQ